MDYATAQADGLDCSLLSNVSGVEKLALTVPTNPSAQWPGQGVILPSDLGQLPSSGGVDAATSYAYDSNGRLIQTLGPMFKNDAGDWVRTASWTVYGDHEQFMAQGYATYANQGDTTPASYTLVNPVSITKYNGNHQVTDQIQAAIDSSTINSQSVFATFFADLTSGVSKIAQADYTAWTANLYKKDVLWETAVYYDIAGATTLGSDGFMGSKDVNFTLTAYGYESYGNAPFTSVGRQNMVENDNGTITRSVYDENNNVLQTWVGTDDSSASDSDPSGTNPLTGIRDPNNNMVEVSSSVYDADRNLIQATAYQYTGAASAWVSKTPTPRVTQMFYDWRDHEVATKEGVLDNSTDEESDGVQRPITYNVLDNLGEITATYVFSGSGVSVSSIADYTTDATPDPSSLLRSYSTTLSDSLGNVCQTADYSVDQASGAIGSDPETTNYSYDGDGNLVDMEDPRGNTTHYYYDGLDRQIQVVDPPVSVFNTSTHHLTNNVTPTTTTTYDAAGNVLTVMDPDGNVTSYKYDGIGRKTEVVGAAPDGTSGSLPSPVITYVYNAAGLLQSVTDPVMTTSYTYDDAGRQLTVSTPDPNSSTPLTSTTTYDGDGNVLTVTDPMGYKTTLQYDLLDHLIQTTQPNPGPGSNSPVTYYVYDNLGELLSVTDAMGRTTIYGYNVLGQQVLETDPSAGSSGQASTATTYDALGGVLTTTDTLHDTTTNAYDGFHRLWTVTDPDNDATTYTYDAK